MFWKRTFLFLSRFAGCVAVAMARRGSHDVPTVSCKRLTSIVGDQGKQNDVIVCGPLQTAKQHVLFFGGDVQDYKENMVKHNELYQQWDLETTAQIVQSQFPDSVVFVVKPSQMLLNTFSMYMNFLTFDEDAKPEFTASNSAFIHLKKLYENALGSAVSLKDSCEKRSKGGEEKSCDDGNVTVPVKIIGFSKGCVVVNQLIFGLKSALETEEMKTFLDQVIAVYWLDGGHVGGSNAYITDNAILKTLVDWGRELVVNVTPYQVKDPMRRWIGKEEKEFITKLKDLKAKITENRHFMKVPASIDKHFEILKVIH